MPRRPTWAVPLIIVLAAGAASAQGQSTLPLGDPRALSCGAPRIKARLANWAARHPEYQGHVATCGIDALDAPPERLTQAPLQFPRAALEAGYEGTVVVDAVIEPDGTVSQAEVLEVRVDRVSHPLLAHPIDSLSLPNLVEWSFRQAAVDEVRFSRFRPGAKSGVAVATLICTTVAFVIRH